MVEVFSAQVEALHARIPFLTRAEIIVEMAKIVASVGDGHTNIYPTRDSKIGFRTLPVKFTFFSDGLYVRAVRETERPLLNAKVVRIGDRTVDEAYTAVKTMIGHENESGVRYWAQYLLSMPEVLEALHITSNVEDLPLILAAKRGEVRVVLHPFAPVEVVSGDTSTLFRAQGQWIDARDTPGNVDPPWLRTSEMPFHFEHIGNVLYVQINQVTDGPTETLAHFSQRLHDEVASTKPDKLAVDLRQNRGGDATLIPPLLRSIIQSESIDRRGHLFGIIGPATFSAAQMLADVMERYPNVQFVGEPSGSKGNAYGDPRKIVLPHSGITVRASIYYWQEGHPADDREATVPEIPAPLTFEDYCRGIDPALEAIQHYQERPEP